MSATNARVPRDGAGLRVRVNVVTGDRMGVIRSANRLSSERLRSDWDSRPILSLLFSGGFIAHTNWGNRATGVTLLPYLVPTQPDNRGARSAGVAVSAG